MSKPSLPGPTIGSRSMLSVSTLLTATLCIALGSAIPASAQETNPPSLELSPCHLDNYRQEVLCGTFTVFENRAAANGRSLDIQVAVLPAVDETKEPDPIVYFAGGPGQSAIDSAALMRGIFREANGKRDIVLVDQRGMGRSHPLQCDDMEESLENEAGKMGLEEVLALSRELLQSCAASLGEDQNLKLYTQDLANADIHDILRALGYEKVNLFGISWGTRSALLYAHRYPEQVRSVILDGNLPLDNTAPLHAAADGDAALRALLDDCATDAACNAAFPDLRADFDRALARIGDGLSIALPNPLTGEPMEFLLTRDRFGDVLRTVLYSSEMSRLLPILIQKTADGDDRPFMGLSFLGAGMSSSMTIGATLAIFCAEEFGRMEPEDIDDALAEERQIGVQMIQNLQNACSVWPTADVPSIYSEDVRSEAPALVLSGAVDPITPPRWGDRMATVLPNALHLTAPTVGHNVSPVGCAPDLLKQFIEQGHHDGLDGSCLDELKRPSFFVDTAGPAVPKAEPEADDDDDDDGDGDDDDDEQSENTDGEEAAR